MTKINMKSAAASTVNPGETRKSRKSARAVVRTITLATMIADIHRDRKNATITPKKARVYLRANYAAIHARNAGWVFTQSEYDAIRAVFDPLYAKSVTRRAKRAARATPAPATVDA